MRLALGLLFASSLACSSLTSDARATVVAGEAPPSSQGETPMHRLGGTGGDLRDEMIAWMDLVNDQDVRVRSVSGSQGEYRVLGWAASEAMGQRFVQRITSSGVLALSSLAFAEEEGGSTFTAQLRFNVDASSYPEGDLEEMQVDVGRDAQDPEKAALLLHGVQSRLSMRGLLQSDPLNPSLLTLRDVPERLEAIRRYVDQTRSAPEAPVLARMQWFTMDQVALQQLGLPTDLSETTVALSDQDVQRITDWVDVACSHGQHGCSQLLKPTHLGIDPAHARGFGLMGDGAVGGGMDWVAADGEGPSRYGVPDHGEFRLEWTVSDHSSGLKQHGPVPKGAAAATVLASSAGPAGRRHVVIVSTRLLQPMPRWRG